jgi:hypothetical protein
LVYYVVARVKQLEGNLPAAESAMKSYAQMLALMMDRLGRMPNYNVGFSAATNK